MEKLLRFFAIPQALVRRGFKRTGNEVRHSSFRFRISETKRSEREIPLYYCFYLSLQFVSNCSPANIC
ncbi:hypothetical protein A9239_04270 [Methanosarcina sp. A14]|nr:hypothetical protein A9239_04270 [Methanosarcina sp. A14]